MKKAKELLEKYTLEGKWSTRKAYVPFMDSAGNLLVEEQIIFTNKAGFLTREQEDSLLEMLGEEDSREIKEYTVFSEGVEPIYDSVIGNFPIALRAPDGEILSIKMSAITGELLPTHAGCCAARYVAMIGPAQSGKTCLELNLMDHGYHNMLSRGMKCSFKEDAPFLTDCREAYKVKLKEMRKDHKLPEPSRAAENIEPFYFLVRKGEDAAILVLKDIDGEHFREIAWNDPILLNNQFIFVIGADELLDADEANQTMFEHILSQLTDRLNVRAKCDAYKFMVMITKADLLLDSDENLKKYYSNSIVTKDGRWQQTIHKDGFNYKKYVQRSNLVKEILADKVPGFYAMIQDYVGEDKLEYCMIASIGEEGQDGYFENYDPFCIDEPMMLLLKDLNLCPVEGNEAPKQEDVGSCRKKAKKQNRFLAKLKNIFAEAFRFDEEEYEYE